MDKHTNTMDTDLLHLQGVKIEPQEDLVMAMAYLQINVRANSKEPPTAVYAV